MPELPEVETTRQAIAEHVLGATIEDLLVRDARLRWPVPQDLSERIVGQVCRALFRRGKYLVFAFSHGQMLVHLGMSGSLRLCQDEHLKKHDHVIWQLPNWTLRLHDPRRFGAVLWTQDWREHSLIAHLGLEPLSDDFCPAWLHGALQSASTPIKHWIMNAKNLVGVGNIYANEALFLAGVLPQRLAKSLSSQEAERLVVAIKTVLEHALSAGGSTLRDFVSGYSQPGYFQQSLHVYGRGGQPCRQCQLPLCQTTMASRQTVFCPQCQV